MPGISGAIRDSRTESDDQGSLFRVEREKIADPRPDQRSRGVTEEQREV